MPHPIVQGQTNHKANFWWHWEVAPELDRASHRNVKGLIFGGTCRSVGIVSNPGHFQESPVTAKILDTRGKKQPKAYAHSNATAISSDYRLVKIELCMIAMMNMEMGLAQ